jgi:hypothetical protein
MEMNPVPPPPRIRFRIELLSPAGEVTQSVSVRGYRVTAHRAARELAHFAAATAYQLRPLRDGKALERRECRL